MKITIGQSEIESAVKTYILSLMTLAEGASIDVDFSATRGPDGLTANINVTPADKVKETPMVLTREPEPVVETAPQIPEKAMRKPRTLTVEQKPAETVSAAPVEKVATTAQAEVTEAVVEEQAASGDDSQIDATTNGFPGFENESQDSGGETPAGIVEKQQTASDDNNATTAEPTTRKSLFGGLGRPSNH